MPLIPWAFYLRLLFFNFHPHPLQTPNNTVEKKEKRNRLFSHRTVQASIDSNLSLYQSWRLLADYFPLSFIPAHATIGRAFTLAKYLDSKRSLLWRSFFVFHKNAYDACYAHALMISHNILHVILPTRSKTPRSLRSSMFPSAIQITSVMTILISFTITALPF